MTVEVIFELFDGAILVVMETGELGLVAIATDLLDVAMSTALVFGPLGLLISDTEGVIIEGDDDKFNATVGMKPRLVVTLPTGMTDDDTTDGCTLILDELPINVDELVITMGTLELIDNDFEWFPDSLELVSML